jgi:IS5 family transposase
MSILPPLVQDVLRMYLQPLLRWFSDYVYRRLLNQAADHLLFKLHSHLDFTRLEQSCAGFHHASGPGTVPTHIVARLVRAVLVGNLYGWSLRQLEQQVRFNLIVKWFVGYGLHEPGPDHTTLERFELWVCVHHHRSYFDEVLHQIDQQFPEDRQQTQLGDTFAVRAQAAREELGDLLAHTCRATLQALATVRPALAEPITHQLQVPALFSANTDPHAFRLSRAEQAQRLHARGAAAQACAQWVTAALQAVPTLTVAAQRPVQLWLTRLEKVLADHFPCAAPAPQVSTAAQDPGAYRLGSATDPEATYRVHGRQAAKTELGYNTQLLTTPTFVREIEAYTGATPDAATLAPALVAQQQYHALTPVKVIYDAAAGTGKTLAEVAAVTHGQTQLVAPLRPPDKRNTYFTADQFALSPDGQTVTCPQGQQTALAYRQPRGDRTFCFPASHCRGCPRWAACRPHQPTSQAQRQVSISRYRAEVDAARRYAATASFQADRRQRAIVERIIAALVRYNGARQARRRGVLKTDFQMKMAAMAYNLKKWMRQLDLRAARARSLPRVESAC